MKLNQKLSLWFLAIALCVGAVNLAWIQRMRMLETQFRGVAKVTTRKLVALERIKFSFLEMIEASVHYSVLDPQRDVQQELADTEQDFQRARQLSQRQLSAYKASEINPEDQAFVGKLEQWGDGIADLGGRLIELKKQQFDDTRIVPIRQGLVKAKKQMVAMIDNEIAGKRAPELERQEIGRAHV